MKVILAVILLFVLGANNSYGQIVFDEPFDEPNGSTSGSDNVGGVGWSATCVTCLGGDWFEVQGGVFEGLDTNGPAVWESELIDISTCNFFEINFDLVEFGTMEGCGTGCNSVDWVQLEYNIDASGWQVPNNSFFCAGLCAGLDVIQADDITGGVMAYSTGCIPGGTSLQVRITVQCWAATEIWQIDNVIVQCALPPAVGAGPDQTVCEGQSVTLTAANPDLVTITWDGGVTDGVSFVPPLGTTTYTVTATDPVSGCSNTDQVDITVVTIPVASITPAGPFPVSSGTQTIIGTPGGGVWSSDCGPCIDPVTGVFDPAVAGVGTWQICYTIGVPPCDDQDCINIDVTAGCGLLGTTSFNNPTCYLFADGSATINTTGGTGALIFTITDSLGNQVNFGNSNTANNLATGWYYINVIDDNLCEVNDSVFLQDPGQLMIDLLLTNPQCWGYATGFAIVDSVYNATGTYSQISYFWNPNPSGSNGIGEDSLLNLTEGTYNLVLNDENGCSESFDFTISWPDSLYFQEIGYEPAYCRLFSYQSGNGVVFASGAGGTGNLTYEWINLTDPDTSNNTTWGGLNPGVYQMTITDDNGCTLVQSITLDSLNPLAAFDLTSPQFTSDYEGTAIVDVHFVNQSLYFANPNNPTADTTFFWNFGFNNDDWLISHDINEEFDTSYTISGIYEVCLVAINKNGCTDTACVEIVVTDPLLFVPVNVFTPNGDGINDEFTFNYFAQSVAEFECTIVNRWGIVINEMTNIADSWNGTNLNGSTCPEGVYFYIYSGSAEDGTPFKGQGIVHLVRSD